MNTPEAPTNPAQESPSPWQRFRSLLGLCIASLVLLALGVALPLYVFGHIILGQIILGGHTDRIDDIVIGGATGLTVALILAGLKELWLRRREAEAADESGVRSSSDAAVGSE